MGEAAVPETIPWRIQEWFPDIDGKTIASLRAFFDFILDNQKNYNLLSAKTLPFTDALHFADSILASRIIFKATNSPKEIYDFGTGAGLPGLVFAILYPQVLVHLVESDQKKVEFLRMAIQRLGINNVALHSKAIEALDEGSVQLAFTRNLSSITKTVLSARKCFAKGGSLFHIKGEEWGLEVSEIPTQLCSIWSPSLVSDYKLPIGSFKFSIVKTEKIS